MKITKITSPQKFERHCIFINIHTPIFTESRLNIAAEMETGSGTKMMKDSPMQITSLMAVCQIIDCMSFD